MGNFESHSSAAGHTDGEQLDPIGSQGDFELAFAGLVAEMRARTAGLAGETGINERDVPGDIAEILHGQIREWLDYGDEGGEYAELPDPEPSDQGPESLRQPIAA